jgi:hypothetical protein
MIGTFMESVVQANIIGDVLRPTRLGERHDCDMEHSARNDDINALIILIFLCFLGFVIVGGCVFLALSIFS